MIDSITLLSGHTNHKYKSELYPILSKLIPISEPDEKKYKFKNNNNEILNVLTTYQNILFILLTAKKDEFEFYKSFSDKDIVNFSAIKTDNKSNFILISEIISNFVKKSNVKTDCPILEGESKKFYKVNDNIALIELKPTMYSFTHNRYGIVEGTDELRAKFWSLFSGTVNDIYLSYSNNEYKFNDSKILDLASEYKNNTSEPFPTNYLATLKINNKIYIAVYFKPEIPPIEVIWKNYLVGTMKHNLKEVDKYKTRYGKVIEYESVFPKDIIRFDWRNKLPNKDEAIPDDYANFYTDVHKAKITAKFVTHILKSMLSVKHYELVDLCYFITYNGDLICSEITPDGMRIRKKDYSFDKDLWRQGKDSTVINTVWNELYSDLTHSDFEF